MSSGMEKLQKAMTLYVQGLAKRKESDDRDKLLPVGYLGATMIGHGQDFQPDSEFGNCLISTFRNGPLPGEQDANRISGFGRVNEAIARKQETYVANATTTWLESVERSLAQMKEYQVRASS